MTTATAEPTREQQITERLAALQAARDAIPNDDDLPMRTTRGELAVIQQRRATLDQQLRDLRKASAAAEALGDVAADTQWLADLTAWRHALCEELQSLTPPRDPVLRGKQINLTLSIKTVDAGPTKTLADSGYGLETLRLGQLMVASGYAIVGADPDRNFVGTLPWHGSLRDVEKRLAVSAEKRARVEAALEAVLMSDEARAAQDATAQAERDALSKLVVKHASDSASLGVWRTMEDFHADVPYLPEDMTPIERAAFEKADAAYRADLARRGAS